MESQMARYLLALLAWVGLWSCVSDAVADTHPYPNLRFVRHDSPEGPFRQTFVRLYADRDGFLWGSTLDSVFRFDGHRFQQWPVVGGSSAAFSEDAAGNLWMLTEQELWRFDPQRIAYMRIPMPKLSQGWGITVAHGLRGTWLLVSDGSLYRYSVEASAFQLWWSSPPQKHMIEARTTADGAIWWLTDRALWRFSPTENRTPRLVERFATMPRNKGNALVIKAPEGEALCMPLQTGVHCVRADGSRMLDHRSETGCSALRLDARGRLHALCGDTLWSQHDARATRLQAGRKLPRPSSDISHQMQLDKNGRLWIGLGNGYGVFDPETGDYQAVPIGQEDDSGRFLPAPVFATNVMLADRNNVWFALNGKGLYRARLTSSPFEHWAAPGDGAAATAPLLRAVYEDGDPQGHELWLADAHHSIWRIPLDATGRLGDGIPVAITSPSKVSECRALIRGPDGVMLYATQDRLFAYRKQVNTFVPVKIEWPLAIPQTRTCGLHRDTDNRLWIYGDFGIAQLLPAGATGYRAKVYASGLNAQWDLYDRLYEGSDGWWWIPYRNGIQRFDPKRHRWEMLSHHSAPLGATWIHQVLEQPAGIYWLATRGGGLQRVDLREGRLRDPNRWQAVHPPPDSHSPIRYSVLADADGYLWLAGGRGLDRYDPVRRHWLHFDTDDGLQQIEFNHGAATALTDGRLVFVGLNGLTIVHPKRVDQDRSPPIVRWQGMQLNGGSILAMQTPLLLDYDKRALTVHYLALDYDSPQGIRYRYRMRSDLPWVEVGDQRQLHFAGLSSGDYALELQAAHNHGDWAARGVVLPIQVASPWYMSWQTKLLAFMLLSVGAFAYIVARNRQQRRLEIEVTAKTFELRQAADSLRASNAHLAQSNAELERNHDELSEQKVRLELALSARERLFRLVSHEFRTPLTKIVLPLDEMIRNESDLGVKDRLYAMRRGADHLRDMIDNLLDKAKADSEMQMRFEKIVVADAILATTHDFVAVFEAKRQKLTFACDLDEDVEAMFTRDCLPIILGNLLENASKYTIEGGQVHVFAYLIGRLLILQVSDTGIGMDESTCAHLYSPFYRGRSAQDSGAPGHGLGLYLVFDVVHRHGGEIHVESAIGRGTTFTVRLPISNSNQRAGETNFANRPFLGRALRESANDSREETMASPIAIKTLLIVEDEPEVRALLVDQLCDKFRCLEAPDGNSAVSIAENHFPDMILCDIDLPGMNGYEVCMSLKEREQTAHIPVIFLTAYASDSARLRGLRAHGDDYIVKPPSMDELRLKIANRLRTRDALLHRVQNSLILDELALPDVATKDQEFVAKAIKFKRDVDAALEANYTSSKFGTAALAKVVHRSTRTLQRHMEQYGMGSAPLEYMREFRLGKASELLRENRRVSEAATACGLDIKNFSDVFKQRYGKTPSEWRKANISQDIS